MKNLEILIKKQFTIVFLLFLNQYSFTQIKLTIQSRLEQECFICSDNQFLGLSNKKIKLDTSIVENLHVFSTDFETKSYKVASLKNGETINPSLNSLNFIINSDSLATIKLGGIYPYYYKSNLYYSRGSIETIIKDELDVILSDKLFIPNPNIFEKNKEEHSRFILTGVYTPKSISEKLGADLGVNNRVEFVKIDWELYDKMAHEVVLKKTTYGASLAGKHYLNLSNQSNNIQKVRIEKHKKKAIISSVRQFLLSHDFLYSAKNTPPIEPVFPPLKIDKHLEQNVENIEGSILSTVMVYSDSVSSTGFIISKTGFILTTLQGFENKKEVRIKLNDGTILKAKIIRKNNIKEVALLKIDKDNCTSFNFNLTTELGQDVTVVTSVSESGEANKSISKGIVSGKRKILGLDLLQTDVPINLGAAGAPLLNSNQQVIGIILTKVVSTEIEAIGFAIPIEVVLKSLGIIISK